MIGGQDNLFDVTAIREEFDSLPELEGKWKWIGASQLSLAISPVDIEAREHNLVGRRFKLNDGNILFDVHGHIKRGIAGVGCGAGGHGAGEGKQS